VIWILLRLITNLDEEVVQHVEYVPFGEVFIEERNNTWNTPYLFNAKELDEETGNYYYGKRYYEPRISQFLSVDRFAEEYPSISSYAYCANNPLKYTDPTGDTIRVSIYNATAQTINSYYYGADANGNYGFIGSDGALYQGNDSFANSLTTALGKLREKGAGRALVDDLANSTNTVTISNSKENATYAESNTIGWNDANANPGSFRPGFVGLGHEMGHIQAVWNNITFPGTMPTLDNGKKIDDSEIYTTHIENQIRAEHGIPLRTHYAYDIMGNGVNSTRVLNVITSASLFYTQQQTHSTIRIVNGYPVVTNTIVNVPFIYRGY
jgi:RHS repeat-associated protein